MLLTMSALHMTVWRTLLGRRQHEAFECCYLYRAPTTCLRYTAVDNLTPDSVSHQSAVENDEHSVQHNAHACPTQHSVQRGSPPSNQTSTHTVGHVTVQPDDSLLHGEHHSVRTRTVQRSEPCATLFCVLDFDVYTLRRLT